MKGPLGVNFNRMFLVELHLGRVVNEKCSLVKYFRANN